MEYDIKATKQQALYLLKQEKRLKKDFGEFEKINISTKDKFSKAFFTKLRLRPKRTASRENSLFRIDMSDFKRSKLLKKFKENSEEKIKGENFNPKSKSIRSFNNLRLQSYSKIPSNSALVSPLKYLSKNSKVFSLKKLNKVREL